MIRRFGELISGCVYSISVSETERATRRTNFEAFRGRQLRVGNGGQLIEGDIDVRQGCGERGSELRQFVLRGIQESQMLETRLGALSALIALGEAGADGQARSEAVARHVQRRERPELREGNKVEGSMAMFYGYQ